MAQRSAIARRKAGKPRLTVPQGNATSSTQKRISQKISSTFKTIFPPRSSNTTSAGTIDQPLTYPHSLVDTSSTSSVPSIHSSNKNPMSNIITQNIITSDREALMKDLYQLNRESVFELFAALQDENTHLRAENAEKYDTQVKLVARGKQLCDIRDELVAKATELLEVNSNLKAVNTQLVARLQQERKHTEMLCQRLQDYHESQGRINLDKGNLDSAYYHGLKDADGNDLIPPEWKGLGPTAVVPSTGNKNDSHQEGSGSGGVDNGGGRVGGRGKGRGKGRGRARAKDGGEEEVKAPAEGDNK